MLPPDPDLAAARSKLSRVPDPAGLLSSFFAFSPVAFQIYEADGHCSMVNDAFRALFAWVPPPEYNVFQDELAERKGFASLIRRALAGETIHVPPTWFAPGEHPHVRVTEGRHISIETALFPLRDEAARVTHVAATFDDRTERELERERRAVEVERDEDTRVRADERLRGEAERDVLHAIIEQSADGIVVVDAAGKICKFNLAAVRQHGTSQRDVPPEKWADVYGLMRLNGERLPLEETPLYRALSGERVEDARWRVRQPSGDVRTLAGSATPLRTLDGQSAGAVLITRDETQRLATEEALRKSEERVRGIVAVLTEGITIQDADGKVIHANASAGRLLGVGCDEIIGTTASDPRWRAMGEDGSPLPGERSPSAVALRTGRPVTNFTMAFRRPDDTIMWLSVNAQPLFDHESGRVAGVVTSFFDITERRLATEERGRLLTLALAGEEQFKTLVDTIPLLAWYSEPDGNVRWYNRRWHEYTGTTLEEQAGWQWQSVHHPADLPRVLTQWKASLESGEPFDMHFRLRRHDGVFRWFLTRAEPLRDASGRIVRWFGSNVDIDDQKRAERSLRVLAEAGAALVASVELSDVLESVARVVLPALGDWTVVELCEDGAPPRVVAVAHVDPAKESLLRDGLAVAPDPTKLVSSAALPPDLIPFSSLTVPLTAGPRTFGKLVLASTDSGRRYDDDDRRVAEELAHRIAIAVDVARLFALTERERRRAEEANRAKDEFLSVASHELRTPLNAILGWSRMLRSGSLTPERQSRALETIERNAQVQVQLVEDILDVSRIITGKLRLDLAPVDIEQVLETAVDVVRPAADAKGVRLDVSVESAGDAILADAGRLQQVVWNLVSNGVKFTPKGGRVRLSTHRDASELTITVSDDGQGIVPVFLPHLFEPFRQADASSTRAHGGLGLGLAIVKHLVELHGGRVEASSEGPGKGATFSVRIPAVPAPTQVTTPSRASRSFAARGEVFAYREELEGVRVLVVDDEPDALELIQSVLERCAGEVCTAASVSEAFDLFRERPPDVVVSDIGMPGEDGYALVRRIRALGPGEGGMTPAIALTAYTRADERARALSEGFTAHLSKPIEPRELVAAVAAAARRTRPPVFEASRST